MSPQPEPERAHDQMTNQNLPNSNNMPKIKRTYIDCAHSQSIRIVPEQKLRYMPVKWLFPRSRIDDCS
jgi:hypothetical protein